MYLFFKPKTDAEIKETFAEANVELKLEYQEYKDFEFRVISTKKELDTTLPNLIFVHGSPGSAMDFKRYLLDSTLNSKVNMIAFDRVGYGQNNLGELQNIDFERNLLNSITKGLDLNKTILVGYSYGGPIALASKKKYKKIILLAPEVYSKVEPMFWFLNFYKWKATRWMLPKMLQTVSKEKMGHPADLKNFEEHWGDNPSVICVIHGDRDWIVPFENATYIQQQFKKEQFKLITLKGASHDLVWTHFKDIKEELLNTIKTDE